MTRAATGGQPSLARVVGVPGAVLLGLGSILGTGIFVSIGIAAGVAGDWVVVAVVLAAVVAGFNGLSSAELAANHPVSGGTYEYGYRYLNPTLGFVAGWMFVSAKSASAATAALGLSGYLLNGLGVSGSTLRMGVALAAVAAVTLVVVGGIHRSNRTNAVIVGLTVLALLSFVVAGARETWQSSLGLGSLLASDTGQTHNLLHATALMFVAYTGYGRVATLGEEIREPHKSIPKAIILTLVATMLLYVAVAVIAIGVGGARQLADATRTEAAPLEVIARGFAAPGVAQLVAGGAITAMLGVLLNLVLGLSRVLLAMARRGDMPSSLARLGSGDAPSPRRASVAIGVIVAALTLTGSVKTTWSFSAFTVLVYYALTNLAALRLPREKKLYPYWVAAAGLVCCLGLAFWVTPNYWLAGLALIAVGLVWHRLAQRGKQQRE